MSIFCKVDGKKFEQKESSIYCSLKCVVDDCTTVEDNGCHLIKTKFVWDGKIIYTCSNNTRRLLYSLFHETLRQDQWFVSINEGCSPYCVNFSHFKIVDRGEFLAETARKNKKLPDFEEKRLASLQINNKYRHIRKTQEKLNNMSDEELAKMMRAVFQTMVHELGVGEDEHV